MHVRLAILDVHGLCARMPSRSSTAGHQPLVNNLLVNLIKIIMSFALCSINSLKSKRPIKLLLPLKLLDLQMRINSNSILI